MKGTLKKAFDKVKPKSLWGVFALVASAFAADFLVFGVGGMFEQIGHGSIANPQPVDL